MSIDRGAWDLRISLPMTTSCNCCTYDNKYLESSIQSLWYSSHKISKFRPSCLRSLLSLVFEQQPQNAEHRSRGESWKIYWKYKMEVVEWWRGEQAGSWWRWLDWFRGLDRQRGQEWWWGMNRQAGREWLAWRAGWLAQELWSTGQKGISTRARRKSKNLSWPKSVVPH